MSHTHHISRTLLYEIRDQALQALSIALSAHQAGPQPQTNMLTIDRPFLQRAIAVLPMLTGSVRGIQHGLSLLFGVHRSVGYISQTLQAAGSQAAVHNACLTIPQALLGEADEIFQGSQPCLTVVDGRSFLVVTLCAAEARDATTWGGDLAGIASTGPAVPGSGQRWGPGHTGWSA